MLYADYRKYMKNRPEVKTLMHDFLQSLLVHKPDDVVAYATKFFSGFAKKVEPLASTSTIISEEEDTFN